MLLIIRIIIVLLASLSFNISYAQNQILQLENTLNQTLNDSTRISTLITLSNAYLNIDFTRSIFYAEQALSEENLADYPWLQSNAITQMAYVQWLDGNYHKAIELNKKAIQYRTSFNDLRGMAKNYNHIALAYYYMADYDSAVKNHENSLRLYELLSDSSEISKVLRHIGLVYHKQANYPQAIDYLLRSLRIKEKIDSSSDLIFSIQGVAPAFIRKKYYRSELDFLHDRLNKADHNNVKKQAEIHHSLGMAYFFLEEFHPAVRYFKKTVDLMNKMGEMPFWHDLGKAYSALGKYDSAIYAHKMGYANSIRKGTRISEAIGLGQLGDAYKNKGVYERALYYYKQSMELHSQMKNLHAIANLGLSLSEIYRITGESDLAYSTAVESLNIAKKIRAGNILHKAYSLLSDLSYERGDLGLAYQYEKDHKSVHDSLTNAVSNFHLALLNVEYESEKKQREIAELDRKNQLQQAEIKIRTTITYATIGIVFMLLVVALTIGKRYRQKKNDSQLLFEQKQQIEHQNIMLGKRNKEKEILLGEIHHRVKNNLQVISSLLSLQSLQLRDAESRHAFMECQNRIQAMGFIHEGLYQKKNIGAIDIGQYIKKLTANLISSFGYHPGHFNLELDIQEIYLDFDTAMPLGLICNELVSNALKYGCSQSEEPCVFLGIRLEQNSLNIEIKDNGHGFHPDYVNKSFGLRLVEDLVRKLNGEIFYEQQQGSKINIWIHKYKIETV